MKFFIRIIESTWFSETEMMYTDDKGRCFVGKPINFVNGDLTVVEATNNSPEQGCHRIVQFIENIHEKD